MKKVLINLVILVAIASIFTTGAKGQTAKNDPNAIGTYQMTPTQSMGQLDGTQTWQGNVSRDVALDEAVETLNRYNEQLDWGFAPVDKDYYVASILPKLKTGNLEPGVDDPLIAGKSGTNKVSTNNNPGFTKDDLFWYWDVRSFNHPSETYRVYLHKVICNNGVEYFQKLEEVPLVNTVTKIDTVRDSIPYTVYVDKEKLVEVPVGTTTAAMPDIVNNNYNYNTNYPSGSTGGYSEGGNYWSQQPSYGSYGGQSCYPGCFLCSFLGYLCPIHCGNSHGGYGSGCNYQQSCSSTGTTGGTSVVINVTVVVEEDNDEEEGDDDDDDGGPDPPDDDGPKGPNIPDDDEINGRNGSTATTTEGVKPPMGSDTREIVSDQISQNTKTKVLDGKPQMGSVQSTVKGDVKGNVAMVDADEILVVVQNPKGEVQNGENSVAIVSASGVKSTLKGEDGISDNIVVVKPSVSKGNTVKSNTGEAVAVAPVVKNDSKGTAVKSNSGESVAVDPVVKSNPKGNVTDNNDAVAVVPVVKTDLKGKVVKNNTGENQDYSQNNTVRSEGDKKPVFLGQDVAENITKGDKPKYVPKVEAPKNNGGSKSAIHQKQQGGKKQATNQSKSKVAKKKVG